MKRDSQLHRRIKNPPMYLPWYAGPRRNREPGVCVAGRVCCAAQLCPVDGAVLHLGIWAETVDRTAWAPANGTIGELVGFASGELHASLLYP